jgi:DNA-binding NarL/FixJ family response regulator
MPAQHDPTQRPRPITVVVVDDEQMIRGALAQTLTGGGLDLVGEASSARDALRLVVDVRPDVVLMDLRLPDSPGVQAIEQLALLAPSSRILILTRTEKNRLLHVEGGSVRSG